MIVRNLAWWGFSWFTFRVNGVDGTGDLSPIATWNSMSLINQHILDLQELGRATRDKESIELKLQDAYGHIRKLTLALSVSQTKHLRTCSTKRQRGRCNCEFSERQKTVEAMCGQMTIILGEESDWLSKNVL